MFVVAASPLAKAFTKEGKIVSDNQVANSVDNSTDGGKISNLVAIGFIASVIYFICDTFFGLTEYYAGKIPWQIHVTAGIGGYILASVVLHRASQLSNQGKLMAVLYGLGIGLAAYPFLIRANAWTDNIGLTSYVYTLQSNNIWEADETVPDITFDLASGY